MAARTAKRRKASSTVAILTRHHGPEHPAVAQARRALDLARTEDLICEAIEQAPPLDAETISRLHALIPPSTPTSDKEAA